MKTNNTEEKEEYTDKSKSNYLDLILIFLFTIFSVISVITPYLNDSYIRMVLGVLFILFLPGYSLIAALFPKIGDLESIERVALSFGLSIAISPLLGLALNYTPFGIRLTSILALLSIFTFLMLLIAFLRRRSIPDEDRFSVNFKSFFNEIKLSFISENRTGKILSIVLIASIVVAIFVTAYVIAVPKESETFTEFYLLGSSGKANDYPTNLTVGQSSTVIVGIVNHENANVTYKLVVKLNNQTLSSQNLAMVNNQTYQMPYNFQVTNSGSNQKLEFLLYKLPDENNSYRDLNLWINVI